MGAHHLEDEVAKESVWRFITWYLLKGFARLKRAGALEFRFVSDDKRKISVFIVDLVDEIYVLVLHVSERKWPRTARDAVRRAFAAVRVAREAVFSEYGPEGLRKLNAVTVIEVGSFTRSAKALVRHGPLPLISSVAREYLGTVESFPEAKMLLRDMRWILRAIERTATMILQELLPILRTLQRFFEARVSRLEDALFDKGVKAFGPLKEKLNRLRMIHDMLQTIVMHIEIV